MLFARFAASTFAGLFPGPRFPQKLFRVPFPAPQNKPGSVSREKLSPFPLSLTTERDLPNKGTRRSSGTQTRILQDPSALPPHLSPLLSRRSRVREQSPNSLGNRIISILIRSFSELGSPSLKGHKPYDAIHKGGWEEESSRPGSHACFGPEPPERSDHFGNWKIYRRNAMLL